MTPHLFIRVDHDQQVIQVGCGSWNKPRGVPCLMSGRINGWRCWATDGLTQTAVEIAEQLQVNQEK